MTRTHNEYFNEIYDILQNIDGLTTIGAGEDVISANYLDKNVVICITDEEIPRLRIMADLIKFSQLDDDEEVRESIAEELLVKFMDMNDEIDPVSIGVDTREDSVFRAINTIRIVDLQSSEIEQQINELVGIIPQLLEVIDETKKQQMETV